MRSRQSSERCSVDVNCGRQRARIGVCSLLCFLSIAFAAVAAPPPIVIEGDEQQTLDLTLPFGGLEPAHGVANIQVFRASRAAPELADGKGWTYHHHVDLAAWKGRLYLAWNSTEKDEDVWPSRELYATSADGVTWSSPAELFPMGVSTGSRMYFFCAPNGRMLAIAGLRTTQEQMTERKKGALVVREILADHTLGPVHVLRPPNDPGQAKSLPRYRDAADKAFVEACEQLLANKPFLEQADYGYLLGDDRRMKWHDVNTWPADEPSRDHFPNRFGKAMSFYHRKDGALVSVMKWGWVLVSHDEGETWSAPVRPPTFVSGMAKAWGQRTGDGRYALVYNPDLQRRYPLVLVHGDDGQTFCDMRVLHGDVPPLRYPGLHKSPGPQYVRGISEWSSDGSWPDAAKALWVCYSVNKEDIWVSRVPLPLSGAVRGDAWNTYSPRWAPASIATIDGAETVQLEDRDPADYARATKILSKPAATLDVSFDVRIDDGSVEPLHVELTGPRAARAVMLTLNPKDSAAAAWQAVKLRADCPNGRATVQRGDQPATAITFDQPVDQLMSITFRTGDRAGPAFPDDDRPADATRVSTRNVLVHSP